MHTPALQRRAGAPAERDPSCFPHAAPPSPPHPPLPQDAKKGILFESFPTVLQLQLKRFEYDFRKDMNVKVGAADAVSWCRRWVRCRRSVQWQGAGECQAPELHSVVWWEGRAGSLRQP